MILILLPKINKFDKKMESSAGAVFNLEKPKSFINGGIS
jgi:hypothetical protein